MPKPPLQGPTAQAPARHRWQQRLGLALVIIALVIGFMAWRSHPSPPPQPVLNHTYEQALEQAHNGKPGAARMLYQQLARTDLSDIRRASLLAELGNYPSPQALKLVEVDLSHDSPLVREAAINAAVALLPGAQRGPLLGPVLDDSEPTVRFAATRALLGLTPDDLGLYFSSLQDSVDAYKAMLRDQPPSGPSQLQLARLFLHEGDQANALAALRQAVKLAPDLLEAAFAQIELLDQQGQSDLARQQLARLLEQHPASALLQHALGTWLLHHGQNEYALLGLAKAVELEPDNIDYRYDLAVALHDLEQLEAAQKQLVDILQRQPGNRRARILLIHYWKENGQLQKVQVLLAELEQQNPDDPALQQGL